MTGPVAFFKISFLMVSGFDTLFDIGSPFLICEILRQNIKIQRFDRSSCEIYMLCVSECMAELPLRDALPRNLTVQNVHFFCG